MSRRHANLDPSHRPHGFRAIFRWGVTERLLGRRRRRPAGAPASRVPPDLALVRNHGGPPRVTWIGHASFLGTLAGRHFLVDPVFSRRVGWLYRRHGLPGLAPADLPPVDALLVSHNHYDHLDEPSVRALPRDVPVLTPEGNGRWFRRRGFHDVRELGWWDDARVGSLHVTLVPACHWSRRHVADTNRALWGGFVVEGGGVSLYHAGDTAWFDGFATIGRRFPGLAAALLPVGAYSPPWFMEHYHLNPEQAGRAFLELRARILVPMHWGAFQLTDEPLCEPVERIRRWWDRYGPRDGRVLDVPSVGRTLLLSGSDRDSAPSPVDMHHPAA